MMTYTETLKTWSELSITQREQVVYWFQADEITNPITGLEFVIDDTGAVVGCTSALDSKWGEGQLCTPKAIGR